MLPSTMVIMSEAIPPTLWTWEVCTALSKSWWGGRPKHGKTVCEIDEPLSRKKQAATCTHVFLCPPVSLERESEGERERGRGRERRREEES